MCAVCVVCDGCVGVSERSGTTRRKRFRFDVVEKAGRKTIFFLLVRIARTTNYTYDYATYESGDVILDIRVPVILYTYSTCSSCVSLTFFFSSIVPIFCICIDDFFFIHMSTRIVPDRGCGGPNWTLFYFSGHASEEIVSEIISNIFFLETR